MTNGDKIRSMTDEELVEVLHDGYPKEICDTVTPRECRNRKENCRICILDWLKQEVENEENTNIIRKDI